MNSTGTTEFSDGQGEGPIAADYNKFVQHRQNRGQTQAWLRANKHNVSVWKDAARSGNPKALLLYGLFLWKGVKSTAHYESAFRLLRKAAKSNLPVALFSIATMLIKGEGVEKNELEALRWYRQAASLGDSSAMAQLGWMYSEGIGAKQDIATGFHWSLNTAALCLYSVAPSESVEVDSACSQFRQTRFAV